MPRFRVTARWPVEMTLEATAPSKEAAAAKVRIWMRSTTHPRDVRPFMASRRELALETTVTSVVTVDGGDTDA
jgi:hypothetical protein